MATVPVDQSYSGGSAKVIAIPFAAASFGPVRKKTEARVGKSMRTVPRDLRRPEPD